MCDLCHKGPSIPPWVFNERFAPKPTPPPEKKK